MECECEPRLYKNLEAGFADVINRNCGENEANVPDFIIAEFLVKCFEWFNSAVKKRDRWYSVHLEPCNSYFETPPAERKVDGQQTNTQQPLNAPPSAPAQGTLPKAGNVV